MNRDEQYRRYCDERMAQQIRDNSQELRELETKIRAAYVTKALKAQLAEHEKQNLEKKLQIQNEIELMRQRQFADIEYERQQKEQLRSKQAQHRIELQEQIVEKRRKRKILYKEFLKEKIIIDEIIAQIQREQIEYVFQSNH